MTPEQPAGNARDPRARSIAVEGTAEGSMAWAGLDERARASESLHLALLKAVLDPTVAVDGRGIVLLASDSVETVFGWKPAELVGRNVSVLMPDPHRSQHDDYLARYRETGETQILGRTREFEVAHADGHRLVCELSVARADIPGRSEPVFIGSFRDVSARRRAERALAESERRFHAIFDRSFEYVGLLAPDGTVLEINQTALKAVGAHREDVVGVKFGDTPWWRASEHSRARVERAIRDAARGSFVRFEAVHQGRGSAVRAFDFSLNPVRDPAGQVVLLIAEGRDITDLKRAQRAETAMLRALAAIGEQAAVLAHEIKNPIAAVNLALRAVSHQLGEDHRAVLEDLVSRMQRLENVMRRTLTFAKPLELKLATIAPGELLDQVVRQLRPEIVKRGAQVTTAVDPGTPAGFEGDRQLLDEVLTNLLRNALEAVGEKGAVELSACLAGRTSEGGPATELVFAVDDNGPGIADSVRTTLFKPFVTTKSKGTGLGLAFCRKVVEEHGGTIEAQRSARGGARFEIRLPARTRKVEP